MDCAEEVAVLKREVGPIVGGEENLAFDVLRGRMTVLQAAGEVNAEAVQKAVARSGMRAEVWQEDGDGRNNGSSDQHFFAAFEPSSPPNIFGS